MDTLGAIYQRHSVRQYEDRPLGAEKVAALNAVIEKCNKEGGLDIQLVLNEEKAFGGMLARYGNFSGVKNYIALAGKAGSGLNEKLGYYGEKIVLEAQKMGLNTCWVALTYKRVKTAYKLEKGEKMMLVIAVGYGANQGRPHKNRKSFNDVARGNKGKNFPAWFKSGVDAALLAPTAVNQQKFKFELVGERGVHAKHSVGSYADIDLGIVKYHFEVGAGRENFDWVEK